MGVVSVDRRRLVLGAARVSSSLQSHTGSLVRVELSTVAATCVQTRVELRVDVRCGVALPEVRLSVAVGSLLARCGHVSVVHWFLLG